MNATAQRFASNPQLVFWSVPGDRISSKCVRGTLGKPNTTQRLASAMRAVSGGTGDDAGHLIARRFGGPDAECNLSRQNWIQNRAGGTFYNLEEDWAAALDRGASVQVFIEEKTRAGAERTLYRHVEWTVVERDGRRTSNALLFMNSPSVRMRAMSGDDPALTRGTSV